MSVPKFFEFFVPVLTALYHESPLKASQIYEKIASAMHLTPAEMAEMLPSGRQQTYKNRILWSIQYLKNAGLINSIARGTYEITEQGKTSLLQDADKIDLRYLEQFDSFIKFHKSKPESEGPSAADLLPDESITPLEAIGNAYNTIRGELSKSLLKSILSCSPDFFETLVIDLLLAMGYGYDSKESGMVVGKTGDGGIDGIINEDKLGFSQVYVQAKRWNPDQTVSSPDVQAFAGALLGKGASKGLFITTSQFSKAARKYVEDQKTMRIVLVDGSELTRLMIDNGVGVSVQQVFKIMQIDNDYFET